MQKITKNLRKGEFQLIKPSIDKDTPQTLQVLTGFLCYAAENLADRLIGWISIGHGWSKPCTPAVHIPQITLAKAAPATWYPRPEKVPKCWDVKSPWLAGLTRLQVVVGIEGSRGIIEVLQVQVIQEVID